VPIGIEEAHDPLGLLKRLDKPIQQNPVKSECCPCDVRRTRSSPAPPDPKPATYPVVMSSCARPDLWDIKGKALD
jgi:hypothetical protein